MHRPLRRAHHGTHRHHHYHRRRHHCLSLSDNFPNNTETIKSLQDETKKSFSDISRRNIMASFIMFFVGSSSCNNNNIKTTASAKTNLVLPPQRITLITITLSSFIHSQIRTFLSFYILTAKG
jgi:hypothetical protein